MYTSTLQKSKVSQMVGTMDILARNIFQSKKKKINIHLNIFLKVSVQENSKQEKQRNAIEEKGR